jgi:hypothetical protein
LTDFDAASDVVLAALPCGVERDRLQRLVDGDALIGVQGLTSVAHDARDGGLDQLQRRDGSHSSPLRLIDPCPDRFSFSVRVR